LSTSFTPFRSTITPQWPWSVYSHRQTSAMTVMSGTWRLIPSIADCTGPEGSHDEEPMPSFFSGSPKSSTARMPASYARRASSTASRTRNWNTPGIDPISVRARDGGTTNSG
jgi:hypothetical protein